MTTKKKKELQPSSILLTLLILYIILYLLFIHSRANEADKTLFDTIGNILSLGINAVTIFFVFKTYKSQKDQIEFQQKEIEDNKKDVEFNRALEIIYRQLQYTEKRFNPVNNAIQKGRYYNYINASVLESKNNNFKEVERIFFSNRLDILYNIQFFNSEFEMIKDILDVEGLPKEARIKLINIYCWNIDKKLRSNLLELRKLFEFYFEEENKEKVNPILISDFEKILIELGKSIRFLNAEFN